MADDQGVPSRLAQRAGGGPVRGLGSGFAQNQAIAGVRNPEAAAKLAGLPEEHAQELAEESERISAEVEERRSMLLEAIQAGRWKPKASLPGNTDWPKVIAKQPADVLYKWYIEMQEALNTTIEAEDQEAIEEGLNRSFAVQPDDPLYDPMVDKQRRKRIEATLKDLDFESMVFQGYVEQEVQIHKSLALTFRTISTQHGLWLEYFVSKMPEMSTQNLRHTFSLLQVAASLEKINGKGVVADTSKFLKQDQRDEFLKAIEQRMETLGRMPSALTDDLIIQYIWFMGRVRKLLSGNLTERVGNS
jgi:hypothetical protein